MTVPAFAGLDASMAAIEVDIFGQPVSLLAMKAGAAGPNAARVSDPSRARIEAQGIRSEFADRVDIGDNGMGRRSGTFATSVSGVVHVLTLARAGLAWEPQRGDRVIWTDRPSHLYEIAELLPDGGAGLHYALNEVRL